MSDNVLLSKKGSGNELFLATQLVWRKALWLLLTGKLYHTAVCTLADKWALTLVSFQVIIAPLDEQLFFDSLMFMQYSTYCSCYVRRMTMLGLNAFLSVIHVACASICQCIKNIQTQAQHRIEYRLYRWIFSWLGSAAHSGDASYSTWLEKQSHSLAARAAAAPGSANTVD